MHTGIPTQANGLLSNFVGMKLVPRGGGKKHAFWYFGREELASDVSRPGRCRYALTQRHLGTVLLLPAPGVACG